MDDGVGWLPVAELPQGEEKQGLFVKPHGYLMIVQISADITLSVVASAVAANVSLS